MILAFDQLKNKELKGIKGVLKLSFEYMLASIAKEYANVKSYKTIDEFNKENRLSLPKALLYPFFVSLSNGHSESLFSLYGEFYPLSYGPVSMEIFSLIIEKDNSDYFDYKSETGRLKIKITQIQGDSSINDSMSPNTCFDIILQKIKKTDITFAEKSIPFEEIKINSDLFEEKELFLAIESGIKAIKNLSPSFFNSDSDIITLHASYFDAFNTKHSNNDVSVIEYGDIEKPKDRPFYQEEKEIVKS